MYSLSLESTRPLESEVRGIAKVVRKQTKETHK